MVFFHAFSVTFSKGTPAFSLWITQATAPIAIGSLRPFTGFPRTKFSGLAPAGKNNERKEVGSVSKCVFEACADVIEHQGASVSKRSFSGRIAEAAFKLSSVFKEQPFTLI